MPIGSGGGVSRARESSEHNPPETKASQSFRHQRQSTTDSASHTGGTVAPRYGERRPMMYHVFENELQGISSLNAEALRYFSLGAFFLGMILNIVIGYAFSNGPLSELGTLMLHRATWFIGVLALICFAFGGWAVWKRASMVDQIKRETVSQLPAR